jgi:dTDP-4-dehydrorhamnose reductase
VSDDERFDHRPLVLGADGLLGGHLTRRLGRRYPHTVSSTRAELDLADRFRIPVELERLRPTVVINCAAWSDVDGCERDPARAMTVNRDGPAALARSCRAMGARLFHLSSDYVFDGEKEGEYREDDPARPVNLYGQSKYEGERAVLEEGGDALVLRVSFLFGPGRPTWVDRIAAVARGEGETIRAVDGWSVKPTYTLDVGEAIEILLDHPVRGVLHFAGGPALTRLAFARRVMAAAGGREEAVEAVPIESLALPARRPRQSALDTGRFARLIGWSPRPWLEGLREYLAGSGRDPHGTGSP